MAGIGSYEIPEPVADAVATSLWSHVYTVGGVLLVLFALARLVGERRQPGNTFAWFLAIVLVPYIGVPLFLLLGSRKIRRLATRKRRIRLAGHPQTRAPDDIRQDPIAQAVTTSGAGEPLGGNRVAWLTTGEQTYFEFERRILGAKRSIDIATYILGRDKVGRRIVELLARRAREGVRVRLQLDALGCFFTSGHFVQPLRAAGGEVAKFLPVVPLSSRGSANLRNHRKIAIFDGTIAIVGGHNLATEYLGPFPTRRRWTDLSAVIEGPAVGLLAEVFTADWDFATGKLRGDEPSPATPNPEPEPRPAPRGTGVLQVIASGPDVTGEPLYEGMIAMVQEAKHSIWLITPYFLPDEVLMRSLELKARAGRDVTLILPDRSNHPVTDLARRIYLRRLVLAGARVLAYEPRMLHAKAIIVDDRQALIGSANIDMRSLFVNFEIGVLLHTPTEVHGLRVWAGELARSCRRLSLVDLKRRKFPANVLEELSRLLTPLL